MNKNCNFHVLLSCHNFIHNNDFSCPYLLIIFCFALLCYVMLCYVTFHCMFTMFEDENKDYNISLYVTVRCTVIKPLTFSMDFRFIYLSKKNEKQLKTFCFFHYSS